MQDVRTIVVPATQPGPMWQGIVERSPGRFLRIVHDGYEVSVDRAGTGWYQEGPRLRWQEATMLLAESVWSDEAPGDAESMLKALTGRG